MGLGSSATCGEKRAGAPDFTWTRKSAIRNQKIDGCLLPWLPGTAAGCNGVAIAAVWMELFGNTTCPADGMRGGGGGGAGGI